MESAKKCFAELLEILSDDFSDAVNDAYNHSCESGHGGDVMLSELKSSFMVGKWSLIDEISRIHELDDFYAMWIVNEAYDKCGVRVIDDGMADVT